MEPPVFQWPSTPAEIDARVQGVVADTESTLAAVASVADSDLTFANVIEPLMSIAHYKTDKRVCEAKFLQHCSTDPVLREAADKAGTTFAALKAKSRTRDDVYARVKAYASTPEAAGLGPYESHFVRAIMQSFERSGLALDATQREELQALRDADTAVCAKYKTNLAEDKTALRFTPAELSGCPDEWMAARTDADTGEVVVTLKYPDIIPVLQLCEVAETRRKVSTAKECDAFGNNLELVAEGIALRKKIATLLGYPTWAHFATATRMSGSPEKIHEFLGPLRDKALAGAQRDLAALIALKRDHLGLGADADVELDAWDVSFYSAMRLKKDHGVDHEAARAYFPLDHVVETTMQIYQELLSLKFTEIKSFDKWHDEVRLFVVHDAKEGHRMGHFYLDLHPRDGKYGHAAIFHLLKRWKGQTPVDCMLCNLPAPDPKTGRPALLRHTNCVTFFHEFGHIMHGLLTEGDGNSTTLAKCPRDFVEAPSQMLENWCWTPEGLRRLSKHVDTGEPLPDEMLKAMIAAKNVGEGLSMLRQLYLSTLDLEIHGENPPADAAGLQALVDRLRPEISLIKNPPNANMLRSFGHLMNQYSAAYYGYLWAEVLSSDMFQQRFEANPFSPEAGMRYRKQVLAPGGVGKIADHLETFLGRPPTQDAFLASRGIL
eukprot:m.186522 g.186522  ORF g.186522 m.186522 type:complete len:661 (+) comp16791_c0_seq1:44-2026(+)